MGNKRLYGTSRTRMQRKRNGVAIFGLISVIMVEVVILITTIAIVVSSIIFPVKAAEVEDRSPLEKRGVVLSKVVTVIDTRNPNFDDLLNQESSEGIDGLLYPHMEDFPYKYLDPMVFSCADTSITVSGETAYFLSTYFPLWENSDDAYTNAEVLSAQLYVGMAMNDGLTSTDMFKEQLQSIGFDTRRRSTTLHVTELESLHQALSEHSVAFQSTDTSDFVDVSTLGLHSRFDIDIWESQDVSLCTEHWGGFQDYVTTYGLSVTARNSDRYYSPFKWQEDVGLMAPSIGFEYPIGLDGSESQEGVESAGGSAGAEGDSSSGEHRGIYTQEDYPHDPVKRGPNDPNAYISTVDDALYGGVDTVVTQDITNGKDSLSRYRSFSDYLLAGCLLFVVIAVGGLCIADWQKRRRDPMRNYPKWR